MRNDFLFPDGGCGFKAHLSICNLDVKPQESRIATQRCGRNDTRIEPPPPHSFLVHLSASRQHAALSLRLEVCSLMSICSFQLNHDMFKLAGRITFWPRWYCWVECSRGMEKKQKVYSFIDIFIPGIFLLLQLWRISSLPRTECTAGLHDFAYYCPLYCWKWKYATRMFTLSESLCF